MLLLYIFPSILKFTIPIALLLASALTIARMAADRELEAWMASGVSVLRLAAMPTCLGVMVMLLSVCSALFFEPYSNKQFAKFNWLQTRSFVEAVVKNMIVENSFIYDFPSKPNQVKMLLYFKNVFAERSEFSGVFLALRANSEKYFSTLVTSQSGTLKKTTHHGFPDDTFSLFDGTVLSGREVQASFPGDFQNNGHTNDTLRLFQPVSAYPKSFTSWTSTQFSEMHISLMNTFQNKFKIDSNVSGGGDQLYPKDYFFMLQKEIQKNPHWDKDMRVIETLVYLFKQIAVPLSTVLLPVIGVCLGIQDPRRKQFGVYLSIGLVLFILYSSLSFVQQLILNFGLNPFALLFVTPCVLFAIALLLLKWRVCHPPSTVFWDFLKHDLFKISFQKGKK
jgi:lipopolysaccharide export LptBFGC system permease protein LptF